MPDWVPNAQSPGKQPKPLLKPKCLMLEQNNIRVRIWVGRRIQQPSTLQRPGEDQRPENWGPTRLATSAPIILKSFEILLDFMQESWFYNDSTLLSLDFQPKTLVHSVAFDPKLITKWTKSKHNHLHLFYERKDNTQVFIHFTFSNQWEVHTHSNSVVPFKY